MPEKDAVQLDNLFPKTTSVVLRGGDQDHALGVDGPFSLFTWQDPVNAASKLFASTNTGIYNATVAGLATLGTAVTNGKVYAVQMGLSGGANWLLCFNGTDSPKYYDGTTWVSITGVSVPALTAGPTLSNLIFPHVFKRRLFLLEKNKLSFWYLPIDAVGGALNEFQLGPLCRKGGYVVAMNSWTRDGGLGPDDFAVFITSEGEVVVFQGTNPAIATDWLLVGTYQLGQPLGRKCLMKYAGDVLVITNEGVVPLSKAAQTNDRSLVAYTRKIQNAFLQAAQLYGTNYGWEGVYYAAQSALIFNVPVVEAGNSVQYVMNTVTGAWCRFLDWQCRSMTVFNKALYFASFTTVQKAWVGSVPAHGGDITCDVKTAYTYLKDQSLKRPQMIMPILAVNRSINFLIDINVDFENRDPTGVATILGPGGDIWDTGLWDVALWAGDLAIQREWRTPRQKLGYALSTVMRLALSDIEFEWYAISYMYEQSVEALT